MIRGRFFCCKICVCEKKAVPLQSEKLFVSIKTLKGLGLVLEGAARVVIRGRFFLLQNLRM